jgi:hypothetical protein
MKAYTQNSTTKRIFRGLLAVWMSGVVFLFCCGAPKVQAAEQMESCPLAKKNHCNKTTGDKSLKDENAVRFEAFQNNGLAFDCCGFFPAIFDKVKKVEKEKQIARIPLKPEIESPAPVFIKIRTNTFVTCRLPIQDRSGTYLKNCVFRI